MAEFMAESTDTIYFVTIQFIITCIFIYFYTFGRINSDLLGAWKGSGANAYKHETDHILEKIGSIEDVLNAINESAVKDIRSTYSETDEQLGEFNRNPHSGEGE